MTGHVRRIGRRCRPLSHAQVNGREEAALLLDLLPAVLSLLDGWVASGACRAMPDNPRLCPVNAAPLPQLSPGGLLQRIGPYSTQLLLRWLDSSLRCPSSPLRACR